METPKGELLLALIAVGAAYRGVHGALSYIEYRLAQGPVSERDQQLLKEFIADALESAEMLVDQV